MKCWPEPCTSLKDMFKNLSRRMDFHGNTDVLKICVVGMKSYPSLLWGHATFVCESEEHSQMLLLLQGISWLFKTEILNILHSSDFSAHTHIYIWPVCSIQDQDLHWCYNIVSLC